MDARPQSKLDRIRHELVIAEGKLDRALAKNPSYDGVLHSDRARLVRELEREEQQKLAEFQETRTPPPE